MSAFRSLLGFVFAAIASVAAGQVDTTSPARQSVSLVVANRPIIVLRGPIAGYSAQERVNGVTQRIASVLESDKSPSVSTEDVEDGTKVLLDGKFAFLVTRIDIDSQVGETTRNVAREAAARLERAITPSTANSTPWNTCSSNRDGSRSQRACISACCGCCSRSTAGLDTA
jgi:hypothetical protein